MPVGLVNSLPDPCEIPRVHFRLGIFLTVTAVDGSKNRLAGRERSNLGFCLRRSACASYSTKHDTICVKLTEWNMIDRGDDAMPPID